MPIQLGSTTQPPRLLVVDDQPDILHVSKISLRGMKFGGQQVEMITASSGEEAVKIMRANPDIAVILLDVVMETDSAGLDACNTIRKELGNWLVRILLRTGQPGLAPERETIDEYDIDGYLPKADLTSNRFYSAVRAALKSWKELVELERYRRFLTTINDTSTSLHSFNPLEQTLDQILNAAVEICPAKLAVLLLETFEEHSNPQQCVLHLSTELDPFEAEEAAAELVAKLSQDPDALSLHDIIRYGEGILVPLFVPRELGFGWIYLDENMPDTLTRRALTLLASHAVNALYSTIAQKMLEARHDLSDMITI